MAQDKQGKITGGPSKFDLMLALFDRKGGTPRIVQFTFEGSGAFPFQMFIEQVSIEDGSGESWMIKGTFVLGDVRNFEAHYRTDTRTGWIKEVGDDANVIDLDAAPLCPKGMTVESHEKGGQWKFNPKEMDLFISDGQKTGGMRGHDVKTSLVGLRVMNVNLLHWFLAHPDKIPGSWKGKLIHFWGTTFHADGGYLVVSCLDYSSGKWNESGDSLDLHFHERSCALIRK